MTYTPVIRIDGHARDARLDISEVEPGVQIARISVEPAESPRPQPITVSFRYPLGDIYAQWTADAEPSSFFDRSLQPPWGRTRTSATCGAPVTSCHTQAGENRITWAWSDARNPVTFATAPDERAGELSCTLTLFELPSAPTTRYEALLWLDTRPVPYYEALESVQAWWAAMPDYTPVPIPDVAREPVLSTWYAHQQDISAATVEAECQRAKSFGLNVVIVDDGWQTEDLTWGYDRCGDWVPASTKFPDMRAHVERVQAMGMTYLLWFSVPFVGARSNAWSAYARKLLKRQPLLANGAWGVLDPRFPDVREMLVGTYERAAREWGIDGFKLDFIDEFQMYDEDRLGGGRDLDSVPDAVDQLLTSVSETLRRANPDVAIEFRQTYTGPLMRRFGNMLRASDCPCDALENRVRTLALRLLAGSTPVHSDPLVWDPEAKCEVAAAHMISALFAVPQISMPLETLRDDHAESLRFWLGFWREHRDTLLEGCLRPLHPELNYPLVIADGTSETVAALYHREVVRLEEMPPALYIVNGTSYGQVYLELPPRTLTCVTRDCRGRVLANETRHAGGLDVFAVPTSGLLEVRAAPPPTPSLPN